MYTKANADAYALALYELINENYEIRQYYDFFVDFNKELISKSEIHLILGDPKLGNKEKFELINLIRDKFKDLDLGYFINFLKILVENGRVLLLPRILKLLIIFIENELKLARAKVYSAFALDEETILKLKNKLEKKYGLSIIIEHHIDQNIISGFKIVLNNDVIEQNMEADLQKIQEKLLRKGGLNG
ncbi:UNVERIFIED_CONTAM: ATP synthase F1 subunit delta [Campylobacter lari]